MLVYIILCYISFISTGFTCCLLGYLSIVYSDFYLPFARILPAVVYNFLNRQSCRYIKGGRTTLCSLNTSLFDENISV